ncbi:MAG: precorrin-8X methylmutase [Deltaproteobacteria bacterium]|nr:precorrin-8X methylmutase [Deltaproteobacteria bacterium]MCK5255441.1 precorrin-8X methylmutase [Deltaproteobacteria bacterium]
MLPEQIEEKSFQLIEERVPSHSFDQKEWTIVRRMIHATVDFDLVHDTKFHPEAISKGIAALRKGAPIITDTKMVKAGISLKRLRKYKTKILCAISHPEVIKEAKLSGKTRASVAMQKMSSLMGGSIVAIGNAPTALFEILELAEKESQIPSLIIGVPVGLVGASESKEMLMKKDIPYITVRGEKGGSPLAVSIINGLAVLALGK